MFSASGRMLHWEDTGISMFLGRLFWEAMEIPSS